MKSLICVLLGLACARDHQHFEISYDPCEAMTLLVPADATASQRASIDDALAMWAAVATLQVSLADQPHDEYLPIVFQSAAPAFFGIYDDTVPEISINTSVTDERERAITIAHELGHAMDLYHVYDRASVMNTPNLKTPPQASDETTLESTWGSCVSLSGGGPR